MPVSNFYSLFAKCSLNFFEVLLFIFTSAKRAKKTVGGHQLARQFPEGFTLTDLRKAEWKLGKPIGSGGFGLLYLGLLIVFLAFVRISVVYCPSFLLVSELVVSASPRGQD